MVRTIITEVPETVRYDLGRIEAAASFGAAFSETVRQLSGNFGRKVTIDNLADMLALHWRSEVGPKQGSIRSWMSDGCKPACIEDAKAIASALKVPETVLTRFYDAPPLYEKK